MTISDSICPTMIMRQFEVNNIRLLIMREIKRDCCEPEVVWFNGRSWYCQSSV